MPDTAERPRTAVIGAGVAGMAAARRLVEAGLDVRVFDKGRGPGGRLATRRTEGGPYDHGPVRLAPSDPQLTAHLERMAAAGHAARWAGGWIGTPSMSALVKPLATGASLQTRVRVAEAAYRDGWHLAAEDGASLGRFELVLSTVPAPQARSLAPFLDGLEQVRMAPQWALMLGWAAAPDLACDLFRPGGAVSLIARMDRRPGRAGPLARWVVHASPDWSRAHLEAEAAEIPALMAPEIAAALGRALPAPDHVRAHRWRYARTERPLGRPFAEDASGTFLAGGDWALGPDADHAWASGTAMAEAALARVFR